MALFKSSREKRLWIYAGIVLLTIISTLAFGQPLVELFESQDLRAVIFLVVMVMIGIAMILHGIKTQPSKAEILVWLGLAAVFIMLFLRLGMAERSHLMEYSVLAIFIHMALRERSDGKEQVLKTAFIAFAITFAIGILDECIQIFLPNRVFDPNDIIFNGSAAFMAIGARLILQWIKRKAAKQ